MHAGYTLPYLAKQTENCYQNTKHKHSVPAFLSSALPQRLKPLGKMQPQLKSRLIPSVCHIVAMHGVFSGRLR